MKKLRGIGVDCGGSGIRVRSVDSDKIIELPNDLVSIPESSFRIKDVAEPKELCRFTEAPKDEYLGIIARGLTGKSYDGQAVDISSQDEKTSTVNYYRQFLFGVARDAIEAYLDDSGYNEFDGGERFQTSSSYFKDIEYMYGIATCIPVKEFDGKKECDEMLKNGLMGTYAVEFPLLKSCPKVKFTITKQYIGVVPEGGVAIAALRKEIEDDTFTLVVDIGKITSDISIFQGSSLYGKVISSSAAGSTLVANCKSALDDEGFILNDEQVEKALSTNKVKQGAKEIDVTFIFDEQRELFVKNYLKKDIIDILNMNHLDAGQIENIVPLGAPMNGATRDGSILKHVIDICGFENANVKILSDDLRYVNINQVTRFAKKVYNKMRETVLS